MDVEANYLVVKAYQFTTITSVMLLDCFTIPCVVALTFFFLKTRYNWRHGVGVVLCLAGLILLVFTDVRDNSQGTNPRIHDGLLIAHLLVTAKNAVLGDVLCLAGAVLYSVANVGQEAFVKKFDRVEYLGIVGLFAVFINGLQLYIFFLN